MRRMHHRWYDGLVMYGLVVCYEALELLDNWGIVFLESFCDFQHLSSLRACHGARREGEAAYLEDGSHWE